MERRQIKAQSTPSCFQRLCPCLPAKPTARQGKSAPSNCDGQNKQIESATSIAAPPSEVATKVEQQGIAVASDEVPRPLSPAPLPPVYTYTETERIVSPPCCSDGPVSPEDQLTTIEACPEEKVFEKDASLGSVAGHQQDDYVPSSGYRVKGASPGAEHPPRLVPASAGETSHVSPPTIGDASPALAAINAEVDSAWHGPVTDASAGGSSAVTATVTNHEARGSVLGLVFSNDVGSQPISSKCKMCGNTGIDFLGKPCTCKIGQKTVHAPSAALPIDKARAGEAQKVNISAPPTVSLMEPVAAGPCTGALSLKPWKIPPRDVQPAVDAKISSMLDRYFQDDAFWQQVAAEIATVKQRQIVDVLGGALTKGRGRFRVTVPKPYPGVQFRKSKQLNDRQSRFAKQGCIVEGSIEDGGEWLRVNEKDYLPMRMGPIRILEPVPLDGVVHADGSAHGDALDLRSSNDLSKRGLEVAKKGGRPPPLAASLSTHSAAAAAAGKESSDTSKENPSLFLNERLYSDTIQKQVNPFSDSPR